jgi:fumarate hydratase class II
VSFGDAGGNLEMNVYKPLMIYNTLHSIRILRDACENFDKFLVRKTQPNFKRIKHDLDNSVMLVTALSPEIGYDKASEIAHYAFDHDLKLKDAALKLGYVKPEEFDRLVNPIEMCYPAKKKRKKK